MDPSKIPVLQTDRLLLRGPTQADAEAWGGFIAANPDFLKFVPRSRVPRTPQERGERLVASYLDRWDQEPQSMGWAAASRSDGRFVGLGGVESLSESDGEIEYLVAEPFWGQGYATEIAKAVTDYWFQDNSRERITAYVILENAGSVRVVERLGFHYVRDVNYLELVGDPNIVIDTHMAAEYILSRDEYAGHPEGTATTH